MSRQNGSAQKPPATGACDSHSSAFHQPRKGRETDSMGAANTRGSKRRSLSGWCGRRKRGPALCPQGIWKEDPGLHSPPFISASLLPHLPRLLSPEPGGRYAGPEQRDSRLSVDCVVWKSVRGLSLQDGGLESPLFFRDRCRVLARGASGAVLKICKVKFHKKVTRDSELGRRLRPAAG